MTDWEQTRRGRDINDILEGMMREIKFRFWDKHNKQWAWFNTMMGELFPDRENNPSVWAFPKEAEEYFIPCQYTGLHDKNGKEIYEGDIIEFEYGRWKKKHRTTIEWGISGFWAVRYLDLLMFKDHYKVKIIGNIYENPELLK